MSATSKARLDAMIEEATVDCYSDDETTTGFFTMIEDNLTVPFETLVLGTAVTVERIELNPDGQIVAICSRGGLRQPIPILDLPLPSPPPDGSAWIEAYRRWRR